MGGNGKYRWRFSIRRSSAPAPPMEFLCPVTGSLMSDPVVVSSGQTFDRTSVDVCVSLGFSPVLHDGSTPDFSTVFPNLAIKRTILAWCDGAGLPHPPRPDYSSVEEIVRAEMGTGRSIRDSERDLLDKIGEAPKVVYVHAASDLMPRRTDRFYTSSSEESVVVTETNPETPLPLATRPSCYYSSSSSANSSEFGEIEKAMASTQSSTADPLEEEFLSKLKSGDVYDQEQAAVSIRRVTKTQEGCRTRLCTEEVLSALKPLLLSRYSNVQINAVAAVVNLSLEKSNKAKIMRSGTVPLLIEVLKCGMNESQEHAAGALFSLALEEDNRMAIAALGALPPLLHLLRSESERARNDAALALYNLTLVYNNRIKLVKLNAVPPLLEMVMAGKSTTRVLLILCNLAACAEGRSAMLDNNAVRVLVGLLKDKAGRSETVRENSVAALFALSHGNFRFKGMLREAGAVELLEEVERRGSERAREKAKRLLEITRERDSRMEENPDWENLLEPDESSRSQFAIPRGGGGRAIVNACSTEF
ncbi:hypothetical protein MLD38_026143 [Melastoma candidum]|uniref:Uncharacterized protein n=1 Tax=Melastoma candidum TaxID=119954 RepID=A0ACB9P2T1_9MYRT|nr:hypothetical protein MLD38_026143 [Melastoma candidum]